MEAQNGNVTDQSLKRKESLQGGLFFQGLVTDATEQRRFEVTQSSHKAMFFSYASVVTSKFCLIH